MNNRPNKQNNMLFEVVKLVAWHEDFKVERRSVSVHADAVFEQAYMGGDKNSLVTFTLSVKQAELVILVPDTEPAKISWKSIEIFDSDCNRSEKLRGDFHVQQSSDPNKNESIWKISSSQNQGLVGRAWNHQTTPLLKIKNGSPNPNDALPPVIRVEVRCQAEDLKISNIEIKDKAKLKKFHGGKSKKHAVIAAEAYIRSRLIAENLPANSIGDAFNTVLIASITAEAEGED